MTAFTDVTARLEEAREEIVQRLLQCIARPSDRSLGGALLANRFVDHVIEAMHDGNWARVVAWVESTLSGGSIPPGSRTLLSNGAFTVAQVMRARVRTKEDLWLSFAALQSAVSATVAEHETIAKPAAAEALEEVDLIIEGFLHRLDIEDRETAEHSRAVAAWCTRVAARMGLERSEWPHVARGGLLHDIGKMLTPKEILLAPRSLSYDERAIMQQHVNDGVRMIREIPALHHLLPMVRDHHERPDGKGYPSGLKGGKLSLAVRIVTVADCFNAMIGRRPYRASMSPTLALEELERHKGKQFDPEVVDAMIGVVLGAPSEDPAKPLREEYHG